MRRTLIVSVCFLLFSCQTNEESPLLKPLTKPPEAIRMIADDPSLTKEESDMIRAVELILLIEELERSKTYRLETDEEYEKRIKERGKK